MHVLRLSSSSSVEVGRKHIALFISKQNYEQRKEKEKSNHEIGCKWASTRTVCAPRQFQQILERMSALGRQNAPECGKIFPFSFECQQYTQYPRKTPKNTSFLCIHRGGPIPRRPKKKRGIRTRNYTWHMLISRVRREWTRTFVDGMRYQHHTSCMWCNPYVARARACMALVTSCWGSL